MQPFQKPLKIVGYVLVLILFILSIIHYHISYTEGFFTVSDFLKNPGKYHGENKTIIGPYNGSFEGGFYLIYNKEQVKILYRQKYSPPKYGEVKVYGTFNKNGYVEAIDIHNYDYNYILVYLASAIAMIITIIIFFKEWKITKEGIKNA